MALKLDAAKGQHAAESVSLALNGPAQDCVAAGYQTACGIGEDNPAVEHVRKLFTDYQTFFNDQLMPAANRIRQNFLGYAELSDYFNKLDFANVAPQEDVGQVAEANYDMAKDL